MKCPSTVPNSAYYPCTTNIVIPLITSCCRLRNIVAVADIDTLVATDTSLPSNKFIPFLYSLCNYLSFSFGSSNNSDNYMKFLYFICFIFYSINLHINCFGKNFILLFSFGINFLLCFFFQFNFSMNEKC